MLCEYWAWDQVQILVNRCQSYKVHLNFVVRIGFGIGFKYWYVCIVSIFCRVHYESIIYGHTYSKSMDQPSKVANPARM